MEISRLLFRSKKAAPTAVEPQLSEERYNVISTFAWQTLLDCNAHTLPIDIKQLAKSRNVLVFSYQSDREMVEMIDTENCRLDYESFCGLMFGKPFVCYNENYPQVRHRFSIAHELSHLLLQHDTDMQQEQIETEAQMLAARLLMPMCVLMSCDVGSPDEIAALCGVSMQSAKIRFQRYETLVLRGNYVLSPMEQQIRLRFANFIEHYLKKKKSFR